MRRWTPLPLWADLIVAALTVLGLVALAGWVFGSELSSEFDEVTTRVRAGMAECRKS
jgi:hypothetical protein